MKTAVIGANGQLGMDIVAALRRRGDEILELTHAEIEVADADSVRRVLEASRPQVVVNTSAMHALPQCEADPARAFAVNAIGARNLAKAATELGALLYHFSTDYVFDGAKGASYVERDLPAPLNVYGTSKLAGEHFVLGGAPRACVLRVSAIYGEHPCRAKGANFVRTMLKLAKEREEVRVVDDEFVSPTYTLDIAEQVCAMLAAEAGPGLYHVTSEGSCSWYEFAREIFTQAGITTRLERARPGEFAVTVTRPKYSVLENAALKARGINCMPHWQDAVRRYLRRIA